ncbi:lipopolysaccharide biosynthesis protein [Kangiella sp.]|uniref:lipopolysaccharide biosynthesis protein n=1 Tax=Kangiella sp. TaxID=1920245 RepID=UPI003A912D60
MSSFQSGTKIKTMLTGTLLSQVIPLLALPILSRLYSPAEFGYFSLYFVWALILGNCLSLRYEMSIVFAQSNRLASLICQACLINIALASVVCCVLVSLYLIVSAHVFSEDYDLILILSILLSGAAIALANIEINFRNRQGHYKEMSLIMISQQFLSAVIKIFFGAVFALGIGIYLGHTIGLAVVSSFCLYLLVKRSSKKLIRRTDYLAILKRYKKLPLFNLPLTLLTSFSNGFLIIVLAAFEMFVAAGLVGLSRTLINAPVGIVTRSIGKVFFELAAKGLKKEHSTVETFVDKMMDIILLLGVAPAVFVSFYSETLLVYFLGQDWVGVGAYASFLIPVAFMLLLTAWPERVFEVANKQEVILKYQVVCDAITIISLVAVSFLFKEPIYTVASYSVCAVLYNLGYLYLVYKVGNFDMRGLRDKINKLLLLCIINFVALYLISFLIDSSLISIFASAFYMIIVTFLMFLTFIKKRKLSSE